MQEQIDALKKEIEELNERIEELEAHFDDVCYSILDNDTLSEVENVLEFSFLDNFPEYTDENIIILHSNPYRTSKIVNACKPSSGVRYNLYSASKAGLTPERIKEDVSQAQKGTYFVLNSDMFDFSDAFEPLILDAITQNKVYFVILTNDLGKIPQSLQETMRIIQ